MEKRYTKNEDIIEKNNEDKLLLFNINDGKMMELNRVAKLLWQNTGKSFGFRELQKIIGENCYDIKNVDDDLKKFVEVALKKEIIISND
ncbi:MAG: hypothetical protein PHS53_02460 [Candidatus Pacebacteria bacterium]|nr:hypothetical protein [Candidatus Paceibacterota bacterium]MDD5356986.1 hypothetical protein [Candidatus Paceibacterota bacterium]